ASAKPAALLADWRDGRVKQALLRTSLQLRVSDPELFARGRYVPIAATGKRANCVFAFARVAQTSAALVVASVRVASPLIDAETPLPDAAWWEDTALDLPRALAERRWFDVLTGESATSARMTVALARLPAALLISR
ncbi:MAG TPA: hypothetical protein VFE13_01250, partial [Caulobacteraceae bacterium]|nr:hypothetical protein [Caulobacteraceae bacterium]